MVPTDEHIKKPLAELSEPIAQAFASREMSRGAFTVGGWDVAHGSCGKGQSALLVRQSIATGEEKAEGEAIESRARRHFFCNQLQHVTGLFALESLDVPSATECISDERWQVRLRAIPALRPDARGSVEFVASFVEFGESLTAWFGARQKKVELAEPSADEKIWLEDPDRALSALLWIGEIVGAVLRDASSNRIRLRLRKASEIGFLQLDFFTDGPLSPSSIGNDSAFSLLAESLSGQVRFASETVLMSQSEMALAMAVRFPVSDPGADQSKTLKSV